VGVLMILTESGEGSGIGGEVGGAAWGVTVVGGYRRLFVDRRLYVLSEIRGIMWTLCRPNHCRSANFEPIRVHV
jgi:hypothetical protein